MTTTKEMMNARHTPPLLPKDQQSIHGFIAATGLNEVDVGGYRVIFIGPTDHQRFSISAWFDAQKAAAQHKDHKSLPFVPMGLIDGVWLARSLPTA